MKFGIDRLLADPSLRKPLEGKRVSLVAHPASVTEDLNHSLDALIAAGVNVTSAFGPQHGLKGDKQDNMVETADEMQRAMVTAAADHDVIVMAAAVADFDRMPRGCA